MLLFIFTACLFGNLAGDSDHPLVDPLMGDFEAETLENPPDSNPSARTLNIEADTDVIFVEHQNVDLHCSPELFDNEIRMEETTIIVEYMLGSEPRSCKYDLSYQVTFVLEPGTYTLEADGDTAEFQVE